MTTKTHHFLPNHILPKSNQFVVMVIDDMPVNRVLLSKVLSGAGYGIIEAESAEHAIELLVTGAAQPDVIITDVEMPGMDGITLTGKVRQIAGPIGRTPIIVASGNPDADMEMDSYDAGADVFLSKPFNLAQLREEVADAVTGEKNIRVSVRRLKGGATGGVNQLKTRLR